MSIADTVKFTMESIFGDPYRISDSVDDVQQVTITTTDNTGRVITYPYNIPTQLDPSITPFSPSTTPVHPYNPNPYNPTPISNEPIEDSREQVDGLVDAIIRGLQDRIDRQEVRIRELELKLERQEQEKIERENLHYVMG